MTETRKALYQESTRLVQDGKADIAEANLKAWLKSHPDDEVGGSILGSALMRQGKQGEALAVFERTTMMHPGSYAAQGDLGFALMKAEKKPEAIKAFSAAVRLNRQFYQGWCYLSRLLFEAGNIDKARETLEASRQCDPFDKDFKRIQSAMSSSRFAEAESIARGILARQQGHPRAAYALAHLASRVGAHEEAAKILEYSLANFPCDKHVRAALINSYEELGLYGQAVQEAKLATEIDPDSFVPWQILGRVHGHCGDYTNSLTAYDRALCCKDLALSDRSNLALIRGHALKILGRQEESIQSYRESLDHQAGAGAGWWGLADMKTYRFSAQDLAAMENYARDKTASEAQRTQAAFALAKAHEDAGQYEKAFSWYEKANALRPDIQFDADKYSQAIDQLIETFTPDFLEHQTTSPVDGPTPIFIVGLPRSGSTLIEQILASHSQIEGTMELVNLPNILRRITIDGGKQKQNYPASMAGFSSEQLAAYGQAYIDETAIYRSGKPYFIDKMPPNFDKVGLIHMILPRAIIIDARRHPMDCGFSCFKQHFAGGHHFSYSLANIGAYYNGYLRIMDHWDRVLPGKVASIQYESMVSHTEVTVRGILEHCRIPFEDACLRFFENKRPVRTASSEQVRQPIYNRGVAHWKRFERQLEPLSRALGTGTLSRFQDLVDKP